MNIVHVLFCANQCRGQGQSTMSRSKCRVQATLVTCTRINFHDLFVNPVFVKVFNLLWRL